jgi:diguanylate cyclase (GGDEF)-like protein
MDRPTKSPSARSSRTRRFTLPEHDDSRVHRVVEDMLSETNNGDHPDRGRARALPGDPLSALVSRLDWTTALEREEQRRARYERPVSVAVVDVGPARDPDRLIRLIARVLQRETRDADRVARVGPRRFHVLLPETRERGVRKYAERISAACDAAAAEHRLPLEVSVGAAGTRTGESIPDALARALRQLA